jgi:hypothetical protein
VTTELTVRIQPRFTNCGRTALDKMYDIGFVIPMVRLSGARVQPRKASQPTPGHAPTLFGMTS